ncbi:fimbrial biogenesis chaperone [Yersinia kristensenii]|uniref:Putative pili chaperone protein n=2 Tax=Yersinia aleksiciae TaxID=263819 RepID=A0A0T9TBF3_YERAE|nr:molecular chaperone [Yersinia kristensenii]CNK72709.1 putative pili chaperone protein [Yersinia aleksiciae]MDA5472682.1 molecular chaperone [Yersinia kristensenii]MDA5478413.1 molecular chaperone [Yersinia kristensenii]MDA5505346.1 molecular chaperone [Yersinia kristensenii]CFR12093.1 putative pili chaperone protein [Yersinia kristensenii]
MSMSPVSLVVSLLLAGMLPIVLFVPTTSAVEGISLNQTRVVFSSSDKAQTLAVKNSSDQSYLIQSRIQSPLDNDLAAAFVVTPPLFPLRPGHRQLLRILSQGAALPTDRETLFYLSVLAIPAQTEKPLAQSEPAQLSMGFRFTIKLFYRPEGLKPSPELAACQLRVSRADNAIKIENPTPYFQTLGRLTFNQRPVNLNATSSMLSPMSSQRYPTSTAITQVEWQTITDYGGFSAQCQQMLP